MKPGNKLSLNDGYIQLEVAEVRGNDVVCVVIVGGELRSRKGLNLPGIDLGISAFTEHDRECLQFALEHGVDAISQSFVESAADMQAVRQAARELGHQPFLIAKIERSRALERLDEILDAADGIMIARGDLGVEVPIERIAVVQKDIMRRANRRAKPVITATQMLESMTSSSAADARRGDRRLERHPRRHRWRDALRRIGDGRVIRWNPWPCWRASPRRWRRSAGRYRSKDMYAGIDLTGRVLPLHLIAVSVEASLEYLTPAAVFARSRTGATARRLAAFHLPAWIVAVSDEEKRCQDLLFSYGVYPVFESKPPASVAQLRQTMAAASPNPGRVRAGHSRTRG